MSSQLPEGWEEKRLGEICENLDSKRIPITKAKRVSGDIPYYGASGIVDYVADYIFDEDLLLISEDGANLLARTYPIAFSVSGKTWINNHAHVLRFNHRESHQFVEYFFNSISLEPYVSGMAQPKLNQKSLNSIPVPFPPLPEQKRIVAILDKAFEGINQAIANAEKNLANAREIFESYLNDVFTRKGNDFVPLSEVTTDITDGDHSPPPKVPEGIPFITISNINKNTREIDFSDTFKVPEDYYLNLKSKRKPKSGDVLFTVTGSYGIPVVVKDDKKFCFQRHIGLLRPKKNIDSSWLYYALLSPSVYQQATDGATGTAQKTVGLKVLRNILVPAMNEKEQEEIVCTLDIIWKQTQHLESIYQQKLNALKELKQSILQKAFSGNLDTSAIQ